MIRYYVMLIVLMIGSTITLVAQGADECPTPRLQVGDHGFVTTQVINIRETPNGDRLGQLQQWQAFRVVDGSECEAGLRWWQIESDDISGWVAEGTDDDYWLEPVVLTNDSVIDTNTFNLLMLQQRYEGDSNISVSSSVGENWYVLSTGTPDYRVYAWHTFYDDRNVIIAPEISGNAYISATAVYRDVVAITIADINQIEYWDLTTNEQLGIIEDWSIDMDFADDTLIYIGLEAIHGYRFLEEVLTIDTTPQTGQQLAIAPDNRHFAVIYLDRTMELFTIEGDVIASFEELGSGIFSVMFTHDSRQMIYAYCREPIEAAGQECVHHKIIIWDIATGEALNTIDFLNLDGGTSHIELAVNPTNDLLLVSSGADLWGYDIETGEVIGHIADFVGDEVQLLADGKTLIQRRGSGNSAELQVWRLPKID